ncbi:hypothetical protein [Bacillus toyonensis]|uniref:hypothetical protein n=1 Tax=Bacillus toyonensis TaxID=155322 RepID=UPI000BFD8646|nr:hypothetical protein [Bacillus toyonensis]PHE23615.1 hypothetical protein COF73_29260 [Bacillus toyonensis]
MTKTTDTLQIRGGSEDVLRIREMIEKTGLTGKEFLPVMLQAIKKELAVKGAEELDFVSDVEEINQHMLRVYKLLGSITERSKSVLDTKTERLKEEVEEKTQQLQEERAAMGKQKEEFEKQLKEQQEEIAKLTKLLKEEKSFSSGLFKENGEQKRQLKMYAEVIETKKDENERLERRVDANAKAAMESEQLKKDKEELQKKTIEQEKEIEKLQDNAKRDLEMLELKLKNEHMQEINELNQKYIEQIQNEQKTSKKAVTTPKTISAKQKQTTKSETKTE